MKSQSARHKLFNATNRWENMAMLIGVLLKFVDINSLLTTGFLEALYICYVDTFFVQAIQINPVKGR